MGDQRIEPPVRIGHGPDQRATRRNLSVLAQAEQQELEKAKVAKRIGKREIALLAAGMSGVGGPTADGVLEVAEKFLTWLTDDDSSRS